MESPILPKRTITQPQVGEKVAFRRTLTQADVSLFIGVTWDVNPLHTDEVYASQLPIKRRIVPGLLTASLLTHIGGLWAFMASEMHIHFVAPVFIGETITAQAEVVSFDPASRKTTLRCWCKNNEDREVLRMEIVGYPGRFENDDQPGSRPG
jgi:3-hydroxybutyryl-CoA dehydratase